MTEKAMYSNQAGVGINEIGRLTFFDQFNNSQRLVAEIVMPIECLRALHQIIGQALQHYDHQMSIAKEANQTNKSLS